MLGDGSHLRRVLHDLLNLAEAAEQHVDVLLAVERLDHAPYLSGELHDVGAGT